MIDPKLDRQRACGLAGVLRVFNRHPHALARPQVHSPTQSHARQWSASGHSWAAGEWWRAKMLQSWNKKIADVSRSRQEAEIGDLISDPPRPIGRHSPPTGAAARRQCASAGDFPRQSPSSGGPPGEPWRVRCGSANRMMARNTSNIKHKALIRYQVLERAAILSRCQMTERCDRRRHQALAKKATRKARLDRLRETLDQARRALARLHTCVPDSARLPLPS